MEWNEETKSYVKKEREDAKGEFFTSAERSAIVGSRCSVSPLAMKPNLKEANITIKIYVIHHVEMTPERRQGYS